MLQQLQHSPAAEIPAVVEQQEHAAGRILRCQYALHRLSDVLRDPEDRQHEPFPLVTQQVCSVAVDDDRIQGQG